MPISTATRPTAKVTLPHQSMRPSWRSLVSLSFDQAQIVPPTPMGTETMKTRCQATGASTPPMISPRNDPAMAAIELMPSARPRWWVGNASVRIAVEFASSSAPPMPCRTRMEISQIAPASPLSHVTASRIENTVNTANPSVYIRVRPNMSPTRPKVTTRTAVTTR